MTTDEFNKGLDAKLAAIIKEDKPLLLGVKNAMALQSKRIWLEGKNKDGSPIGSYKGGEIYVSPKGLRKKPTLKGKNGKTTFKNGNQHKTGYFQNYLVFKKNIGRNTRVQTVDLFLNGTLAGNWANASVVNIGDTSKATAIKIDAHNYVIALSEENINKVDRYGVDKVFGLSLKEKGQFLAVVRTELANALR